MQDICLLREPWLYNNKINHMIIHIKHIKADFVEKALQCLPRSSD